MVGWNNLGTNNRQRPSIGLWSICAIYLTHALLFCSTKLSIRNRYVDYWATQKLPSLVMGRKLYRECMNRSSLITQFLNAQLCTAELNQEGPISSWLHLKELNFILMNNQLLYVSCKPINSLRVFWFEISLLNLTVLLTK